MKFQLKAISEDFRVSEIQFLSDTDGKDIDHHQYFSLRKKNYETFEAVYKIADFFHVDKKDINFSGLKDKNAITEQYISIKKSTIEGISVSSFNDVYYKSENDNSYIYLQDTGKCGDKLLVADLCGNCFDIVVRDIESHVYKKILKVKNTNFIFINYYDTQRFGIPGGRKITHRVGEAIENKNYEEAISLINEIGDDIDIINTPLTDEKSFFSRVDKRKIAFYLSSHSSFQWNTHIISLLKSNIDKNNLVSDNEEGLPFLYAKDINNVFPLLHDGITYKYKRHLVVNDEIVSTEVSRPGFIQVNIHCCCAEPDELNIGKYKCRLRFFLPMGTYATMAIKQFMHFLYA